MTSAPSSLRPAVGALVLLTLVGPTVAQGDPTVAQGDPTVAQGDAEARAVYEALLARHAEAAALDVIATVEQRIVQGRQGLQPLPPELAPGPRDEALLVEGEAHLARPAAGWLRTSTVPLATDEPARGDSDEAVEKPQVEVDLFELVGDGAAIYEIDRKERTVSQLAERWFAVFPNVSPLAAWTGRALDAPLTVAFVKDPTGAGRRGLQVVRRRSQSQGGRYIETLWLGEDGLLVGAETVQSSLAQKTTSTFTFRTWRLSKEADVQKYVRKPPLGFTDTDVFAQVEEALLGLGKEAPDVTLLALDEETEALKLASLRGNAVLLTFWFVDCPGCEQDLPRVQALWSELSKARDDVRFVGIDLGDGPDNARRYWSEQGCTFPTYLQDADQVSRAFGVRIYPTTFVLGKDGKVLWRSSGFDATAVRAILEATR